MVVIEIIKHMLMNLCPPKCIYTVLPWVREKSGNFISCGVWEACTNLCICVEISFCSFDNLVRTLLIVTIFKGYSRKIRMCVGCGGTSNKIIWVRVVF